MRLFFFFFFSSRRRHTRFDCDWSSDVCSSDLCLLVAVRDSPVRRYRDSHDYSPSSGAYALHVGEDGACERSVRMSAGTHDKKASRHMRRMSFGAHLKTIARRIRTALLLPALLLFG